MKESNQNVRSQYELDKVPGRKPVFQWETGEKYEVIQFCKSSKSRKKILQLLLDQPMTTGELSRELNLSSETIFYHIDCLAKGEKKHSNRDEDEQFPSLVESKTPAKRTHNLWGLTEDGYYTAQWLVRDAD